MSFELIEKYGGHEEVVYCHDAEVGLKAIIAVHNTTLGPALGGTRMWPYQSEEDALVDVLRLSKGMTYKASVAGLNLGGGKAVIIGDPKVQKSEALFRAFGAYVNALRGKYITAEDVGTSVKDMEYVFMETPYVTGIPQNVGGSGDPSPYTARGVIAGIKASVKEKFQAQDIKGMRVAVQGLGHVGAYLVDYLVEEGAVVLATDVDQTKIQGVQKKHPGIKIVAPDEIMKAECDVFAPCALGAVINDQTLDQLKCKVVAGAANNQLASNRHGLALKELGILYAPDYVINSGGLINVYIELEGYSPERAIKKTNQLYDNLMSVFAYAKEKDISTHEAADQVAEKRIAQIGNMRQHYFGRTTREFSSLKHRAHN